MKTRKVVLEVELEPGLAELAEALQKDGPELLAAFVRYGIMRHAVYTRMHDSADRAGVSIDFAEPADYPAPPEGPSPTFPPGLRE